MTALHLAGRPELINEKRRRTAQTLASHSFFQNIANVVGIEIFVATRETIKMSPLCLRRRPCDDDDFSFIILHRPLMIEFEIRKQFFFARKSIF